MSAREPVLNAFQSVRPRGADAPSAVPILQNVGRAPGLLPGSSVPMAMDRSGRRLVPVAPRLHPGGFIENREQSRASADKRQAIVRGGI